MINKKKRIQLWQVQTYCCFSVKFKDKSLGKAIQYISAEPNQCNLNAETRFHVCNVTNLIPAYNAPEFLALGL